MALATTTTRTPKVTRCPVCGGLECLCRPRFFAGQLLTEDDLNRLERYIIEKNKLHNRYLVGWGVVCGLEVICNPCRGFVTVKSGYALSPCGDDIVVCRDETVNVCDLIQQCRQQQWECDPAWPRPDPICGDKDEPWILYLCYDERASRGITPLQGGSGAACCSSCSCGGSSSCGCGSSSSCGCGSKEKTTTRGNNGCGTSRPQTPPQCEPTVTCEGYSFRLQKVPPKPQTPDLGEWFNRLLKCAKDLAKLEAALNSSPNQPSTQILAVKSALLTWMEQHAIYNCDLYQRIAQVELTPQDPAGGPPANAAASAQLSRLIRELFRECFCSTLLPPCPEPAEENCVPIATVTLNCQGGCRVVRICNLEHRRSVVTFPILQYFLGGFVKQLGVQDFLSQLCCGDPFRGQVNPLLLASLSSVRRDFLDEIFDDAVKANGNLSAQAVLQRLAPVVEDFPSRFRNP